MGANESAGSSQLSRQDACQGTALGADRCRALALVAAEARAARPALSTAAPGGLLRARLRVPRPEARGGDRRITARRSEGLRRAPRCLAEDAGLQRTALWIPRRD